jgi:hypothetical protein
VAHQDFVWKLRADERLTSIFAALWGELQVQLMDGRGSVVSVAICG